MTSRIEKIESEVIQLSAEELDAFRATFAEYDFDCLGSANRRGLQSGKLDRLAAEAMSEYEAGLTTEI